MITHCYRIIYILLVSGVFIIRSSPFHDTAKILSVVQYVCNDHRYLSQFISKYDNMEDDRPCDEMT